MKDIIETNYNSIRERGLITSNTSMKDFINKLDEEVEELKQSIDKGTLKEIKEELSDVILVCLNTAYHHGFDIEKELKKKIDKNFERAKL